MPDVIINVTPQPTASVEVDVDNVASYYYDLAKQWAISPDLVEQLDYSSKYYANKSEEAADSILTDAGFIAVSQDLTNIDTVANSITNVNAVANDVTNINLVADDLTNIDSVAGSISNVNSVASDLTNINSVASDLTNIDSVAADLTNIDNVAADLTNIDSVASNATNINACASNASNINTVASSIANVNTVASDKTNIDTVAGISGNITTVASISTDVTSVASISSAVSAVNTNASNINTCATSISDINTCAANISTINDKVSKSGDTMTGDLTISKNNATLSLNGTGLGSSLFSHYASGNIKALTAQVNSNFSCYLGLRYNTSDNTDYAEASTGVKQSITNWAFPSATYTDLRSHWGTSGFTVTAPADGFIFLSIQNSGNYAYVGLINQTCNLNQYSAPSGTNAMITFLPVAKGDIVKVNYSTTGALDSFGLVHAIGG